MAESTPRGPWANLLAGFLIGALLLLGAGSLARADETDASATSSGDIASDGGSSAGSDLVATPHATATDTALADGVSTILPDATTTDEVNFPSAPLPRTTASPAEATSTPAAPAALDCSTAYTADLYDSASGHEEPGARIIGTQSWTLCTDSAGASYEFKITPAEYAALAAPDAAMPSEVASASAKLGAAEAASTTDTASAPDDAAPAAAAAAPDLPAAEASSTPAATSSEESSAPAADGAGEGGSATSSPALGDASSTPPDEAAPDQPAEQPDASSTPPAETPEAADTAATTTEQ
jgi:hypothetical protein